MIAGWRIDRTIAGARRELAAGAAVDAALAPVARLPDKLRRWAYLTLARDLRRDEEYAHARTVLARAAAEAPQSADSWLALAEVEHDAKRPAEEIAALRRVLALKAKDQKVACQVVEALLAAGQVAEAVDLVERHRESTGQTTRLCLPRILLTAERVAAALELATAIRERLRADLGRLPRGLREELGEQIHEVDIFCRDLEGEVLGAAGAVKPKLRTDWLDARSGINCRLLGVSLAARSRRLAERLELESPAALERRGLELVHRWPVPVDSLIALGAACLRWGNVDEARHHFAQARELDGGCFPALLGLGAAMDCEHYGCIDKVKALPPPIDHPLLAAVLPDLPSLGDLERRAVSAAIAPLSGLLERVVAAQACARILPLDVRVVDLPEHAALAEQPGVDDRELAGVGGRCEPGRAFVRVEELLLIRPDGWSLAHVLARLAFQTLPEPWAEPFRALRRRASPDGSDELFFAGAFVEHLLRRHGLPREREVDDEVLMAAFAALDRLTATEIPPDQVYR